ncbi:hypothetical protein CALCODRAFT_498118 [Calocera cornea HHB12733]|uniref:Uncharacterized protein n=1 Tax=Calocera cornea HHB12733 TaxID=1353952 RepID=A0A165EYM7_9BASI|nr:hypothetical protein CALCODRAFT_498118 [Calocera cornea HHB12733]
MAQYSDGMADLEDNDSGISVPISTTHRTSKPSRSILKRSRQQAGRFVRAVSKPVAFRLPKRERPSDAAPGEPDVVAVRRRGSTGSGSGGFLRAFLFGAPRMRRERTDDYAEEDAAEDAEDAAARIPDPLDMPYMPRPIVMPHPGGGISFVPPDELPVNPPPLPLDPTPPQEGEYRHEYLRHSRQGVEDLSMPHTGYGAPASGYPPDIAGGGMGIEGMSMMPMPEPDAALSPSSRRSFQSPRSQYSYHAPGPQERDYSRDYERARERERDYEREREREYERERQTDRDAGMPPTPPQPVRRVVHVAPDIPLSPPLSPQSRRSHRSARSRRSAQQIPPPAPPVIIADGPMVQEYEQRQRQAQQSIMQQQQPMMQQQQPMMQQQTRRDPIATDYAYQSAPQAQAQLAPVPAVHIQPPSDGGSRDPSRPVSRLSRLTHRTHRTSASAAPSGPGSPNSLPLNWERVPHAARPMSFFRPRDQYPAEEDALLSQVHFISRLPPTATTSEKLAHVIGNVSRYPWIQRPWQTVQYVPGTKGAYDARYEIPETVAQGSGVASWYSDGYGGEKRATMASVRQSNYAPRRDPSVMPQMVDTYTEGTYPGNEGYNDVRNGYGHSDATPGPGPSALRPPLERTTTQQTHHTQQTHRSRPRSTITIPPPPPPKSPRAYRNRALSTQQQHATVVFRPDGTPELLIPDGAEMPTSPILITDPNGRTQWFMPQVGMARSFEG